MTEPKCTCLGSICGARADGKIRKRTYRCASCRRRVPWCFGAADDMPDVCDDCWCAARGEA